MRPAALFAGLLPCLLAPGAHAVSVQGHALVTAPVELAVQRKLGPPPPGVTDLKFGEIFKTPIGAKGLEPSAKLLALDGKRVRMIGYMVHEEKPSSERFLLSPLPVEISDEDEPLADDLPPSTVSIELPAPTKSLVPSVPGLLRVVGVLHVGAVTDSASGRTSSVQLRLDANLARALTMQRTHAQRPVPTSSSASRPHR